MDKESRRRPLPANVVISGLVGMLVLMTGTDLVGAQPRVHRDAQAIRAYRLTFEDVTRFDQVARAMDTRLPPAATRADVALFVGLQGGWIGGEPWHDVTVDKAVRVIDGGDPGLPAAIRSAGLSPRDYVLIQMTLPLAHQVVAAKRRGSVSSVISDVSPENLAFVEAHWEPVDRIMREFVRRVDAEVKRVGPR